MAGAEEMGAGAAEAAEEEVAAGAELEAALPGLEAKRRPEQLGSWARLRPSC